MLSSVEQAFVARDEIRAPLKTPAWEATCKRDTKSKSHLGMRLAPVRVFSCKHQLILVKVLSEVCSLENVAT